MRFLEILDDRERLREHVVAIDERRHDAVRIHRAIFGLELLRRRRAADERRVLVIEPLQIQRDAHAIRRRTAEIAVELHVPCRCSDHAHGKFADAVDAALQQIALHDRADAFGRAGENQIAGEELEERRQIRDRLADRPDQLRDVGALLFFAVDASARSRSFPDARPSTPDESGRAAPNGRSLSRYPTDGRASSLRLAGRGASCRGRARSRRRNRAPVSAGMSLPCLPIAATSSISKCRFFVCDGYGNSPVEPGATYSTASAGLLKKNGGSRSGSWPISRACAS